MPSDTAAVKDANASHTSQLLQPIKIDMIPTEDEVLVPGRSKVWFVGMVVPWNSFQSNAIKFWRLKVCQEILNDSKNYPTAEPRVSDPKQLDTSHNSDIFADHFQREVLETTAVLYNLLVDTARKRSGNAPANLAVTQAADRSLDNSQGRWTPNFVIDKLMLFDNKQTKAIGHAEYLAGKPGALTDAIKNAARNSPGSLRCVLGETAKWMIKNRVEYGFITSSDEIMFLRFQNEDVFEEVETKVGTFETHHLYYVPKICYSDPIKFSAVLNEDKGTVSARLALFYLLHTSTGTNCVIPEQVGVGLNYLATRKVGEHLKLNELKLLSWLAEEK